MGDDLFRQVTEATGLPKDLISDELSQLLEVAGVERNEMTLDDLRMVLADYVQDVLLKIREEQQPPLASGE